VETTSSSSIRPFKTSKSKEKRFSLIDVPQNPGVVLQKIMFSSLATSQPTNQPLLFSPQPTFVFDMNNLFALFLRAPFHLE
jgi:hypothetical protein